MFIKIIYSKLPVAAKLLIPLLSLFLGLWTLGTFSFVRGNLETSLNEETEEFSFLVLQDFKHKQEFLRSQARWVADRQDVSVAIASNNKTSVLKTLLPIQAGLKLSLLQVIGKDGSLIADLRQGIPKANLEDKNIHQAAKLGFEMSDILNSTSSEPSLLVGVISVKSRDRILGGVIVGSLINDQYLMSIRGETELELVAMRGDRVFASTLAGVKKANFEPPSPKSPPQRVTIDGQGYLAKTLELTGDAGTAIKVILLNSIAPLEQAEQRLWLSIGGFSLLGGSLVLIVGVTITRSLTRRLKNLTNATQNLANGDLSIRIKVDYNDEVGILASGFNFMAEQLTARDRQITLQVQQLESTLKKLQQTQAQLIQSEKMSSLGQMVAGVAHEINNPIGFIHSNLKFAIEYSQDLLYLLQVYQKHYPNPDKAFVKEISAIEIDFIASDLPKIFQSMETGCDRIKNIVISLRNFSRLDEASFKRVNIHEGIDSTLTILTSRLKDSEIEVIKEYGSLPAVECFAGDMNQVFLNILNNAIDALEGIEENGNKGLRIQIYTKLLENDWIGIYIADNALGMTEEVRDRIFDPFFTTKPVGKGTGLGLSICYQIVVEKHGGRIECYSVQGEGTKFAIEIPLYRI